MVLRSLLKSGVVHTYAERREKRLAALPDEQCKYCEGTGQRDDKFVQGTCNGCGGKGTSRPSETLYSFNVEWIEEFAEFAKQSGGFEIC
jgi:DnaJ-class molecular chaperone